MVFGPDGKTISAAKLFREVSELEKEIDKFLKDYWRSNKSSVSYVYEKDIPERVLKLIVSLYEACGWSRVVPISENATTLPSTAEIEKRAKRFWKSFGEPFDYDDLTDEQVARVRSQKEAIWRRDEVRKRGFSNQKVIKFIEFFR